MVCWKPCQFLDDPEHCASQQVLWTGIEVEMWNTQISQNQKLGKEEDHASSHRVTGPIIWSRMTARFWACLERAYTQMSRGRVRSCPCTQPLKKKKKEKKAVHVPHFHLLFTYLFRLHFRINMVSYMNIHPILYFY